MTESLNHGWCRNCGNNAKYDLDGNWWCVTPDCKHHEPKEYDEQDQPNWVDGEFKMDDEFDTIIPETKTSIDNCPVCGYPVWILYEREDGFKRCGQCREDENG